MRVVNLSMNKGASGLESLLKKLDSKETIKFKTSGSTGKPKTLKFTHEQIVSSAQLTADTFKLTEFTKFLCPLSL
ncbi:MAG: hypothetical protein KDC92_12640, partial [Bacteroidetes bacterium]|nr:hypothetical protein [Bacteroidota bacterium]